MSVLFYRTPIKTEDEKEDEAAEAAKAQVDALNKIEECEDDETVHEKSSARSENFGNEVVKQLQVQDEMPSKSS